MFEIGKLYTWHDIHAEVGGDGKQWYLPAVDGRIVAGCFRLDGNPDAPDIILPGNGPFIKQAARQFTSQGNVVPVFIKQKVNQWKYMGMYKVERQSFDKDEINRHAAKANRVNDVSSLLLLKKQTAKFEPGKLYTRDEIYAALGGSKQSYLPTVNGRVVAACFKRSPDTNPDAPDIVLPGMGPIIKQAARQFTSQSDAVPTFIKQKVNQWKYVGMYKVERQSFDEEEIKRYAAKANRVNDVSSVLSLKKL